MNRPDGIPPVVTFESGAALLVKLGKVRSLTSRGLRYIASTHEEWPFGEEGSGKPHVYYPLGNARGMETGPFLAFFDERPHLLSGRGPDRAPRQKPRSKQ